MNPAIAVFSLMPPIRAGERYEIRRGKETDWTPIERGELIALCEQRRRDDIIDLYRYDDGHPGVQIRWVDEYFEIRAIAPPEPCSLR